MNPEDIAKAFNSIDIVKAEIRRAVIGQDRFVDTMVDAFLIGGHVLSEGEPGLGKTFGAKAAAKVIGGTFARTQGGPDTLASDITGIVVYDQSTGEWKPRLGPVFSNVYLYDEINRTPPKPQSALLEVMGEGQVTIPGFPTQLIPRPFTVVATRNLIEHLGTYELSHANVDRFDLSIGIERPTPDKMQEIVKDDFAKIDDLEQVFDDPKALIKLQELVRGIARSVTDDVNAFIVALVDGTVKSDLFLRPAGVRAAQTIKKVAAARALSNNRFTVTKEDAWNAAPSALRHRLVTRDVNAGIDEVLKAYLTPASA